VKSVKKEEKAEKMKESEAEKSQLDDTMVFSTKTSLDEYIIGKQIGQGAYALVRLGLHKPSNQKVAMKIYKKYKLEDANRRKSVKREIKLMEKMKNQHVVQLFEIIDTHKYVILVMEYIGGGSLHGYLKASKNKRLDEDDAKKVFRQIVEGLKFCHQRCITHRDIKLENVLLDEKGVVKLIDFGFSTCIPNDRKIKIFCGTPSYMAPEIVRKTEYCGPPADIWALGVLLFTCLTGQFPYRGATDEELYDKICRSAYNPPASQRIPFPRGYRPNQETVYHQCR
jgi:MAP/microtubule affinity-regulating kinase